jgi:predicted glycogen debranching enzyme
MTGWASGSKLAITTGQTCGLRSDLLDVCMSGGAESVADLNYGREVCGNLPVASKREWLVTNGLGGYAMGTISGELTRRDHGLLIADLHPPLGPTLLVTALAETAQYAGQSYPLHTFRWAGEYVYPHGYRYIEHFRLEGSIPVWLYAFADALLEKRIWMQPGKDTTYVQYRHARGDAPIALKIKALVNYRDIHGETIDAEGQGWVMQVEAVDGGLKIAPTEEAVPYYLLCRRSAWSPRHEWYPGFMLEIEQEHGFDGLEDHLWAGELRAELAPGEELTVAATLDAGTSLQD